MFERKAIWVGISAALIAGGSWHAEGSSSNVQIPADDQSAGQVAVSDGEGEGEGEGEGGSATVDLVADDVAFLKRLGLIRGHLHVGHALYGEGLVDMARTHMKHPRDELYAGLVPAIRARGASPFDEALTQLAEAVESDAGNTPVDEAWRSVDEAIRRIETSVDASTAERLTAIARIVRIAGDEYAIGVVGGNIDNVHEYQDAWGFVQVARERIDALSGDTAAETAAISRASGALADVGNLWPGLAPEGRLDGEASRLHGAAARIELAALSL